MVYYSAANVKSILGEKGATNDAKVQLYGNMADAYINSKLTNVKGLTIPLSSPDALVVNIATLLAVAYFYKFESGDLITIEETKLLWENYFNSKYKRPRLIASTGT